MPRTSKSEQLFNKSKNESKKRLFIAKRNQETQNNVKRMTFNICNALNSEVLGCEPVRCKNWQGSEIPVEKRDEGRKLLLY